jgi:hypothetical protein
MVAYFMKVYFTTEGLRAQRDLLFADRETAMGKNNMRLQRISLSRQG